jgi:NAD-dependent deacetylase
MNDHKLPKIVVLTGAGISAESGIRTFRDSDGLWEEHNILDVATPEAWKRNSALVTRFYNARRAQLLSVKPNAAHLALTRLQEFFDVKIVTQNVDDLHERAGNSNVLHLHGELIKARSEKSLERIYEIGYRDIEIGEQSEDGSLLRPHIVWFGEDVPMIVTASKWVTEAEILIVIGTSLNVYPAAGLLYHSPYGCEKFLVDPNDLQVDNLFRLRHIKTKAGEGVPALVDELIQRFYPQTD